MGMPLHFLFHCGNHKFPMLLGSKAVFELNGRSPGTKAEGGVFPKHPLLHSINAFSPSSSRTFYFFLS